MEEYNEEEADRELQAIHAAQYAARLLRIGQSEAEGHVKRERIVRLVNDKDIEEERRALRELACQSNLLR